MYRYFMSSSSWAVDIWVCFVVSALVTPADPMTMLLVFFPLLIVWAIVRIAITSHLKKSQSGPDS